MCMHDVYVPIGTPNLVMQPLSPSERNDGCELAMLATYVKSGYILFDSLPRLASRSGERRTA